MNLLNKKYSNCVKISILPKIYNFSFDMFSNFWFSFSFRTPRSVDTLSTLLDTPLTVFLTVLIVDSALLAVFWTALIVVSALLTLADTVLTDLRSVLRFVSTLPTLAVKMFTLLWNVETFTLICLSSVEILLNLALMLRSSMLRFSSSFALLFCDKH